MHHLSHGRRHTTRVGMTAWAVRSGRTKGIVIASLIPERLHQRSDGPAIPLVVDPAGSLHQSPLTGDFLVGFQMVFDAVLDLLHKMLKIRLQLNREVVRNKLSLVGIAKYRCGAIIG